MGCRRDPGARHVFRPGGQCLARRRRLAADHGRYGSRRYCSIASSAASLKIGESATITFTFSELPVGFALNDITVGGGTLSGFGLTANPLVYTALVYADSRACRQAPGTIVVGGRRLPRRRRQPRPAASAITPINYSTQAPNTGIATVEFSSDTGFSPNDLITTTSAANGARHAGRQCADRRGRSRCRSDNGAELGQCGSAGGRRHLDAGGAAVPER